MATSTKCSTVGVFEIPQSAQQAVMDLKAAGFNDNQIGVHSRNDSGKVVGKKADDTIDVTTGAATGAAAGAGVGALWGLGILAGVLPGIGPAIAGGTLGVLLSSAAAGAATAGIGGALMGMGLDQAEANFYEGEFKRGRTLVTVDGGSNQETACRIIESKGGVIKRSEDVGEGTKRTPRYRVPLVVTIQGGQGGDVHGHRGQRRMEYHSGSDAKPRVR